ncbi:hypothetical protein Tco_0777734 [Tanacetum coccineum]|uniref:Uncharacterized protein n=1 Tax=Tanacetum coccineum TaxID=301880 RepID=A0ABQ5FUS5_9ASTR
MIQFKEMMQDERSQELKVKRSRSQSMNEQSRYKQEKTKTRLKKAKLKCHIFNIGEDKLLTSSFSKSGVEGCYRTRTRCGIKLSKLYMVMKVALITMVASIMVVVRVSISGNIIGISQGHLGARNSADLLDMLFAISSAEINEVEDTCVWSLGTDRAFSVKDARCIIDSKSLYSLAPSTV